jgi:hypothetical protein
VQSVIPFDHQRREFLLRRIHMIGQDGNVIAGRHDLTGAINRPGCDIVYAFHSAAEQRRLSQRRELHADQHRLSQSQNSHLYT